MLYVYIHAAVHVHAKHGQEDGHGRGHGHGHGHGHGQGHGHGHGRGHGQMEANIFSESKRIEANISFVKFALFRSDYVVATRSKSKLTFHFVVSRNEGNIRRIRL
jgi:hypothetical protein